MADLLHFELVSPEKLLRSDEVFVVVVPGAEGDFSVLAGHAPFMSTIRPGAILVYPTGLNDTPERVFIDGGFPRDGPNWAGFEGIPAASTAISLRVDGIHDV